MLQLSPSITPIFQTAGWSASPSYPAHAEAINPIDAILAEFCGLTVGQCGPGVEQAASDVHFYANARPEVARAILSTWENQVSNAEAFATAHADHMILFVDQAGNFYAFTDPDERFYAAGNSFSDLMQRLLLGYPIGRELTKDA